MTEATPSEPAQGDSTLTITAQDIGPVMAGMTLEEAGQSWAVGFPPPSDVAIARPAVFIAVWESAW
ncbi:MAG: hypothetical protein WBA10_13995 [Elainellaceae cyanobacterium]